MCERYLVVRARFSELEFSDVLIEQRYLPVLLLQHLQELNTSTSALEPACRTADLLQHTPGPRLLDLSSMCYQ